MPSERSRPVFIYGRREVYHLTADQDAPLCWNRRMSKVNAMTFGYLEHESWVEPEVIPESEALAMGRRMCKNCLRASP
jgi:hypothetical protein